MRNPTARNSVQFSSSGSARRGLAALIGLAGLCLGPAGDLRAQDTGTIAGRVVLEGIEGQPIAGATVNLPGLRRVAITGPAGSFVFARVGVGPHELFVQRGNARSERRTVAVTAGDTTRVELELAIAHTLEAITVTGNPRGQTTALESFGALNSVSSRVLAERMSGTLGETLEAEPGVAKRSFGPGSARPIVRGFDGDRVLMMNDGLRAGDVSSQSGDHGVLTDPASLKRVEILKGPATLLYGSNAIGGVVNAISYHDFTHEPPPRGLTGFATVDGGTADERVGANFEVQHGADGWVAWGGGGARRAGDYDTPEGAVPNSASDLQRFAAGGGRHSDRAFLDASFSYDQGVYGVPFAAEFHEHEDEEPGHEEEHGEETIEIDGDRAALRLNAGLRELSGFVEDAHAHVTWIDWSHRELEGEEIGTRFDNRTLVLRAEANQRQAGRLAGTFGVWGQLRDFEAMGEEALSPPVDQRSFALFALEELDFDDVRLAGGLRLETNHYELGGGASGLPDRSFTGVSGSLGLNVPLGPGAALYTNLSRSHRAPALEELYNNGPHVGTLTFEIGDADLEPETTNGLDAGVRYQSDPLNLETGVFLYDIGDYIYLAPTGGVEDGLPVGEYAQGDARYLGFEATADVRLTEDLRLLAGADYVRAELTDTDEPLPRIPPLRGRLGLDWHLAGLDVRPEVVLTAEQDRTFGAETPSDGYTLVNLTASYTFLRGDQQHMLSLRLYNLTDELYRNHSSFIKDLAPEAGRGAQLTYSMRLF
ncbi:MAG: TonB-dependent receptor [Gemmatimonadota bacterium]